MVEIEYRLDPELLRSRAETFRIRIQDPQFTGNYLAPWGSGTRRDYVRSLLDDIYARLNGGCIRDNTALDASVAAFRDGRLSRRGVWDCITADFNSMSNVTFSCVDTTDDDPVAAYWDPNTPNVITLKFAPSWGPNAYAILSEFVHKCGFNDYLMQWYAQPPTPEDPQGHRVIEGMVYLVTVSCFP